jgi:hypothetical protein
MQRIELASGSAMGRDSDAHHNVLEITRGNGIEARVATSHSLYDSNCSLHVALPAASKMRTLLAVLHLISISTALYRLA